MSKMKLFKTIGKSASKFGFVLKKYSPEILAVVGVAGTVTSAVIACKATTKLDGILKESKEEADKIKSVIENKEFKEDVYSEEDGKKDLQITYIQTGVKIVKLYAPAVALGVVSIGCMLASNNILKKRNVALAAAYTAVDKGFKEYRNRVVERFGEHIDKELRFNTKIKEVEEKFVDDKGKEKTVKKSIDVVDPTEYSDYARFFDVGNPNWEKDSEYNLMFLRAQQQYANDMLRTKHYIFLNDVYDMLGIPRSVAGQSVGWVYDTDNPVGDNFVDFGIYDIYKDSSHDFVNGYEKAILLDFNVDGPILTRFNKA